MTSDLNVGTGDVFCRSTSRILSVVGLQPSAVAVAPPAAMALTPLAAATSAAALLVFAAEEDVDPAAIREEAAGVGGET